MISPGFRCTRHRAGRRRRCFRPGVNMEFAVVRGERTVAMRVFERGVGETRLAGPALWRLRPPLDFTPVIRQICP